MAQPQQRPPQPQPAEKVGAAAASPSPDVIEVRLSGLTYRHEVRGNLVTRVRGEVFTVTVAEYEATRETRDGIRKPSSCFALLSDEKAVLDAKATAVQENQDRFMAGRDAAIAAQDSSARAHARLQVERADQAKTLASALAPLDRSGARQIG